jgi:hypothetical protein
MIVDAHVALDRERYPVEQALEMMSAANVGNAVVSAHPRAADLESQNRYVLRVARERNLWPFYYIGGNPYTDTRPDELITPVNLGDYAGIRWHRWVGTGIDRQGLLDRDELEWAVSLMESSEFEALTSAAALYNLPVMFEESLSVTLEFVLRFPSLDIIIPHLGARSGGEANVLRELWDTPNVYFETSLAQLDEITLARIGSQRIFFGSGYPEGDSTTELDKIDRLPIAEEVKEGIFGDNVSALLSAYT